LSGPTGTPIGAGVKKAATEVTKRSIKIPIIAGAVVVAGLIGVVGVMAGGGDDPPTAAATTVAVVDVPTTVGVAASLTTGPQSTVSSPETAAATTTVAVSSAVRCTQGSWTIDNNSFAEMWAATAGGQDVTLDSVNGTVVVDVSADGTWVSSYDNWGFTASSADVTVTMSIAGSDTSTGTFADDGTFTFVDTANSTVVTMTATAGGVNVPIPPQSATSSPFAGVGGFVCNGNTMTVNAGQNPGPILMNRTS
jgi:hypothetical protein